MVNSCTKNNGLSYTCPNSGYIFPWAPDCNNPPSIICQNGSISTTGLCGCGNFDLDPTVTYNYLANTVWCPDAWPHQKISLKGFSACS